MSAHRSLSASVTALTLALMAAFAAPASAQGTAVAAAPAAAAAEKTAGGAPLATLKDKMSYSTGVMTARTLAKNGVAFDAELLVQGLRDGITGGAIRIDEKELKIVLQSMQADIQRKMASERSVKASINRENGLIFQADFRKQPDVTALPGGLMVRVIKDAKGDKPTDLSTVVVRYQGKLIDGTEFDATPEGKTVTMKLTETITGLREALKRMPAGAAWEVVVPPNLAYATRGSGNIGPNETLVFNVELVAVVQ